MPAAGDGAGAANPASAEVVVAEIDEIGAGGDGVAHTDTGERLYVPLTVPGDRVRVEIGERRGGGLSGAATEWLTQGPGRAAPVCRHFGECGGCALQHLSDETYAAWKRGRVAAALRRHGVEARTILPLARTPPGRRRRAGFKALRGPDGVVLGFNARRSHRLVDLWECPVLRPEIAALMPALKVLFADLPRPGGRAGCAVTMTDGGLDVMLSGAAKLDAAVLSRLAEFADAHDLARLSHRRAGESRAEILLARRPARMVFGNVGVEIAPGAFTQASAEGEAALVGFVRQALSAANHVADFHAGCGAFAFPLSAAARVHAIDGDGAAIGALESAARKAGRNQLTAEIRDLARHPPDAASLGAYDAVLFDPPRAGAKELAAEIARSTVPLVCAISCNPATFARDARTLVDGGYRLERVLPVDQFPWSPHLELAALFTRDH
ncbi:MAG: class I SAM-dependent RNA methyltransferase [Alphaproteobacteria bacterium]